MIMAFQSSSLNLHDEDDRQARIEEYKNVQRWLETSGPSRLGPRKVSLFK